MAVNIETQVFDALLELEFLVTACKSSGAAIGAHHESLDGAYAVYYLTDQLEAKFTRVHDLIKQQVLPLVKDMNLLAAYHG